MGRKTEIFLFFLDLGLSFPDENMSTLSELSHDDLSGAVFYAQGPGGAVDRCSFLLHKSNQFFSQLNWPSLTSNVM